MKNPFVFGRVIDDLAFIDREQDLKRLKENISNHINTVLISPRRWGKSSLVAKTGREMTSGDKRIRFCYIDLFNVRSEQEFYLVLASELVKCSFDKWDKWIDSSRKFFKKITPRFSIGSDPMNDFSISFAWDDLEKNPDEILELAERLCEDRNLHIVLCVDEFQNLAFFGNPAEFQKKLRAHWQHHQRTTYVIYGSKRHMMIELFNHPSMPFYRFGDMLLLDKIGEQYWIEFIREKFENTGKTIPTDLVAKIPELMENHPYFVQQLAHETWNLTQRSCNADILSQALISLYEKNSLLFLRDLDTLTNHQINFLKALASGIRQFSAQKTLRDFNLGSSGNVNRIKTALESKEIIDILPDRVEFLDPLFKNWVKNFYLRK